MRKKKFHHEWLVSTHVHYWETFHFSCGHLLSVLCGGVVMGTPSPHFLFETRTIFLDFCYGTKHRRLCCNFCEFYNRTTLRNFAAQAPDMTFCEKRYSTAFAHQCFVLMLVWCLGHFISQLRLLICQFTASCEGCLSNQGCTIHVLERVFSTMQEWNR